MRTPGGISGWWWRAALACCWALIAPGGVAWGYQQERAVDCAPDSGIEIHVALPFGEQPDSGFFPAHFVITNSSNAGHTWQFEVRNNNSLQSVRFKTAFSVGPRQRREFDVLVPWPALQSVSPSYRSVYGTVSGPGVQNGLVPLASHYSGGVSTPRVAIVDSIGASMWPALDGRLKASDQSLPPVTAGLAVARFGSLPARNGPRTIAGSTVRLEELPPDARSLSGFVALWLSDVEWRGLTGPRRTAIRQWVLEGGRLFVTGSNLTGLPALQDEAVPFGFGEIRRVKLDGAALPVDETARRIVNLDFTPLPPWEQDFKENWPLRRTVGEPHLNVPLLIVFVVVFGLLVGPVNLLWFAPPAKRHRLFFTVPLLSAGASLLLLGLIAFGDGLGGDGARNVLLLVPAGESRLTLYQEQIVRTRLLFGRSFQLPETVAAAYIGQEGREGNNVTLEREGTTLGGDWFRTRAVQGLYLQTSIPSRGEVVLRPGPVPELLSSLTSTLHHVFYVDEAGKYWKAEELTTGRPVKLQPANLEEYAQWSTDAGARFSQSLRQQYENCARRPGYFYAEATPTAENTIPTLRSTRWNQQYVLCLGPCTGEATP